MTDTYLKHCVRVCFPIMKPHTVPTRNVSAYAAYCYRPSSSPVIDVSSRRSVALNLQSRSFASPCPESIARTEESGVDGAGCFGPVRPLRQSAEVQQYLSILSECVAVRNVSEPTSKTLAATAKQLAPRMTPVELCEVIEAFALLQYWDRPLINKLFTSLKLRVHLCPPTLVLRAIKAVLQLHRSTNKRSTWPTTLIDVFIEQAAPSWHSFNEGNVAPASGTSTAAGSKHVSPSGTAQPPSYGKSGPAPVLLCSAVELAILASILAQHRLHHQRFWDMVSCTSFLRSLSADATLVLLDSFATMSIRVPETLETLTIRLLPVIQSLNSKIPTMLRTFLKIDVALHRLAFVHEPWTHALDTLLDKNLTGLFDLLDHDTALWCDFLVYRTCSSTPGPNKVIHKVFRHLSNKNLSPGQAATLRDLKQYLHMTSPSVLDQSLQQDSGTGFDYKGSLPDGSASETGKPAGNTTQRQKHSERTSGPATARWENDVSHVLNLLNIKTVPITIQLRGESRTFRHVLRSTQTVLRCLGPSSFYLNTLYPTANTSITAKLLSAKGYRVVPIAYHEWNNLASVLDKKRYIWKLGRQAVDFENRLT